MNKQKNYEIEIPFKNEENDILIDNNNDIMNLNHNSNNSFLLENKKEKQNNNNIIKPYFKFPFIFHFFILVLIFSIIITIIYIFFFYTTKANFIIIHYNWDASYLNDRKYENYIFNNGLEVMLIQDKIFDRDGGAIVIDNGYMTNPYDEGIASIATCLLNIIGINDTIIDKLDDYYGEYKYETNKYYTNFRFDILNNGFKKYMNYFSLMLNPKDISTYYDKYIEDIKIQIDNLYLSKIYNIENKEIHLLEYLVYDLKDKNNLDILPEGNYDSINNYDNDELKQKVMTYIKEIIDPSKIKIVFFSKYKFLISAKYMKKYFQYLTNMEKTNNKENTTINEFDSKKFKTSQILYLKAEYHDTNYINIIYYIDKINNESYIELFHKANYFNYIIDFLNEKKEGSLYYLLTNSTHHNIKSILAGYDIVLKSKIEFYIYIELNCLKNINNIIFLTYQFMDKIIKEAIGNNTQMERYKELKTKFYQDVKYIDKTFNTIELAKSNAERLFDARYDLKYMLYRGFIPWNENETQLKNESYLYLEQLKPENSVIVIGLRDRDKNKMTCNESCPFHLNCDYFKADKNIKHTRYYNVHYINDIFNFNSSDLEINNNANISYIKNIYMTKHNKSFEGPKEKSKIEDLKYNTAFNTFYFKRNVNFSLPKVYITLNLFHPYLRPMISNVNITKCYYFKIMEIFSAIKRKINEYLADAIRAGNEISIGQNENYLYINVFCYEDVAFKIMEKIKYILFDINWESTDFISNNIIYKNDSFEDFFFYNKFYIGDISKYYFYSHLKNNFFNKYEFYPEDFEENYTECIRDLNDELNNLTYFIINGFIYGYYTKKEADNISYLFETNYDLENFKQILHSVNNTEIIDNTPENFVKWIKETKDLDMKSNISIPVKVYNKSDKYDCGNYGISYIKFNENELNISIFSSILENVDYGRYIISLNMLIYEDIYFEFIFFDDILDIKIPNSLVLEKTWNYTLNNFYQYNKNVDIIGNRYYYVKKNFLSTLFKEQTSLQQRAIEEIETYLYERKFLDPASLYDDYNKKYIGNSFDNKELNNTIKYYSNIIKRERLDIYTVKE